MVDENGLDVYLSDRVRKRHYGHNLINKMVEEFLDLRSTGFGNDGLAKIRPYPEPWQVGESFSECFLEDYKCANFPYPNWSNLKNQNASPAGADLVGYDHQNDSVVFLFGEVKTTGQTCRLPSVVGALKTQLLNLESPKTSQQLLLWLGGKNKTLEGRQNFGRALKSYVNGIFKIVGILIRDTVPDKHDLERTFIYLVNALRPTTNLEMLAIYLPVGLVRIPKMMDGESDHG